MGYAGSFSRRGSASIHPNVAAIVSPFPNGPTRGEFLDHVTFHAHKLVQRIVRSALRRDRIRPHWLLLSEAVAQVRRCFPQPVCIETGCIREPREGTGSTLAIASTLGERGHFYTFELERAHMQTCKSVCREFNHRIHYVEGDAKANLRRLRDDGTLQVIHLAFFDSAHDPQQIWEEFRAVEELFVPGSIVLVDDVVSPAVKGKQIKPYLHGHPLWESYVIYTWKGLLIAMRHAAPLETGVPVTAPTAAG